MKKNLASLIALSVAFGSVSWASPQGAEPLLLVLTGVVISEGNPLTGAVVDLRCGSSSAQVLSDRNGAFQFSTPPASCELEVRLDGYYGVLVRGIELREQPSSTIVVALSPLPSAEPEASSAIAPAPALEIRLELSSADSPNRIMTARVSLVNAGSSAISIPTRPWYDGPLSRFFLRMRLEAGSERYGATFGQWFGCLPPDRCLPLAPGESHTFPVTFRDPETGLPTTHQRPGSFTFEATAYLVPPGTQFQRTESVSSRQTEKIGARTQD